MSRAQDAHDCRDAGGRATQEQLPRSDWFSFALLLKLKARAYMDVFTASPGKLIHTPAPPTLQILEPGNYLNPHRKPRGGYLNLRPSLAANPEASGNHSVPLRQNLLQAGSCIAS